MAVRVGDGTTGSPHDGAAGSTWTWSPDVVTVEPSVVASTRP
jgi:hypothetical protein